MVYEAEQYQDNGRGRTLAQYDDFSGTTSHENAGERYTLVSSHKADKSDGALAVQHLAACGICYLGLAFSMLWVMMAKGSKRWYERYERALNYFTYRYDKESNKHATVLFCTRNTSLRDGRGALQKSA